MSPTRIPTEPTRESNEIRAQRVEDFLPEDLTDDEIQFYQNILNNPLEHETILLRPLQCITLLICFFMGEVRRNVKQTYRELGIYKRCILFDYIRYGPQSDNGPLTQAVFAEYANFVLNE